MTKQYSMRGVMGAADKAVARAREFLLAYDDGSTLHDVQNDPRFQHRGVDLLWQRSNGNIEGVEVKGDRHARRKRFFFELISNFEKDTPGCFLYSMADWLVYVFVENNDLYALPLSKTREWFLPKSKSYELKKTQTRTGPIVYTTVGAPVPVRDVIKNVEGILRDLPSKSRRIDAGSRSGSGAGATVVDLTESRREAIKT